jgi:predicted TIM-barrel fold metal-dependent hydrolase
MIIDCHTHLGRNEHINAAVHQLLDSMDQARIDKALVFASDMVDCPNNYLLSEVKPHSDRLMAVAAAYPLKFQAQTFVEKNASDLATLYQSADIKAVKFYTGYDHYYPGDNVARIYLEHLNDVGCPVIFHSGDCLCSIQHAKLKYSHPLHVDDVAVDYPNINFVIAHMGFPWHRDAAEVCYKNPNVYADISGFVYGKFQQDDPMKFKKVIAEFTEIAPSTKLLFGTDFPISDQKSYVKNTQHIFGEHISAPQFMTQNAIKAFKL